MYITFLCRESKRDRSGKSPIEMSVIIDKDRTYIRLPMKCSPEEFKVLRQQKRGNWLKEYLAAVYGDIQRLVSEMAVSGRVITASGIKECYLGGVKEAVYTVGSLKTEYLELLKGRCTYPNWRKYEMSIDLFISVVGAGMRVSKVSNGDILKYQGVVESKYDGSTAYSYLSRLKSFFRYANANGFTGINPFYGIRLRKGEKDVEFLTEDEVKRIEGMDCHGIERLERVRDLFVFQCHTGLAYSDMRGLVRDDIVSCEFGYYVVKERQKTGVKYTVLIDKVALSILEKYGWSLPVLSNQRYNGFLKEIGDLCSIKKPLHTHIARHTCATLLLNRGMSLESVAKVLGHPSTKITKHYAKMMDRTVLSDMAKVV